MGKPPILEPWWKDEILTVLTTGEIRIYSVLNNLVLALILLSYQGNLNGFPLMKSKENQVQDNQKSYGKQKNRDAQEKVYDEVS